MSDWCFVVFSDDWGRHPSSCQHLFRRLARDHLVLWVNTIGLRAAKADRFTLFRCLEKLREWLRPLRQAGENLWVLAPVMLPVGGSGWLGRLNRRMTVWAIRRAMRRVGIERPVLWASVPNAADYIGELGERAVVYYVTDDYSLWPGGDAARIQDADRRLTEQADLLLPCSEPLLASHRTPTAETVLLPHAVDLEHFAVEPAPPEPPDMADIPRPRACFFGLIYEKIDLGALADLAARIPELHLVLIGPVKTDVARLAAMPNVHFLGPRPYEDLPAYLHAMDVIVVPYVLDEETLKKGPLKIRECLAVGKPIVARAIPALRAFAPPIHLYEDTAGFVDAVRQALETEDTRLASRMRSLVVSDTWEARQRTVMHHLHHLLRPNHKHASQSCQVDVSSEPPDWDSYLQGHRANTIFHDPRWGLVMQEAYSNRPFYLTARRDNSIVGILQLVLQKSLLFGTHLSSLPYFDVSGILADDAAAAEALLAEAASLRTETGTQWVELRQTEPLPGELACRDDKITLRLPLPGDPEALWDTFSPKVRNQIRKPKKEGLTLHGECNVTLDEFHAVYVRNMRDLGSPPHSKRFFEVIRAHFGDAVRLFSVKQDDTPLAASFTLTDTRAMRLPWAASDWRFRKLGANMLLYWGMLKEGCERGAPRFDFGRSTRDSGTYRFKKQWGAEEVPLYWQYLLAPGQGTPDVRPDSRKYRLMVGCWQWLPVCVAQSIGPHIIAKVS